VIPRVVHQVWFGPQRPVEYDRYRADLIAMNPGWEFELWDDARMESFPLACRRLWDMTFKMEGKYALTMRSDIARCEIVNRHGGFYLDMDMEPRRPFDGFFDEMNAVISEEHFGTVTNSFFGFEAGHPMLHELIYEMPRAARTQQSLLAKTGPLLFDRVYRGYSDVVVIPSHFFFPRVLDPVNRFPWLPFCDHRYGSAWVAEQIALRDGLTAHIEIKR